MGIFSLYVSFFPQLVAGPIERSTRLLPQFYEKQTFDYQRVISGLKLILLGFFKKVVIADRLANYVNIVYNYPEDYHGYSLIMATYFFAFQIYCDFSGYSDIAIGASRILGFNLMDNFKQPYFSKSISEFWSRWHISLSTWFRDYFYIPIGGNRVAKWRLYYNLFAVFLVSGLWHGANWTFVVWGALHGFYYVLAKATEKFRMRLSGSLKVNEVLLGIFQTLITFNFVTFAWIYFRANSIADANYIVLHLFSGLPNSLRLGSSEFSTIITGVLLIIFIVAELINFYILPRITHLLKPIPAFVIESPVYCLIMMAVFLFGVSNNEFIYFQF